MKIVIPGGSGQIGGMLAKFLHDRGDEVVVLSRRPDRAPWRVENWDGQTIGPWQAEIDGSDVVINLAGRNVNCRYHRRNRDEILQSRLDSSKAVGKAIAECAYPPGVWLQASTATIYAHRYDAPNDEATGVLGGDELGAPEKWNFSIEVARAWEDAAEEFHLPSTRIVLMRSAMTMSPDHGGVFDVLRKLVGRGLGGTNGDGRQYVSWIHERDFLRAVDFLIEHNDLAGPVNLAAPNPLPNAEFMRQLREAAGVRLGLPATRWMLELGAILLRTETELILKSRRVVPGRLLNAGFAFDFPHWRPAAEDLCRRWSRSPAAESKLAA